MVIMRVGGAAGDNYGVDGNNRSRIRTIEMSMVGCRILSFYNTGECREKIGRVPGEMKP